MKTGVLNNCLLLLLLFAWSQKLYSPHAGREKNISVSLSDPELHRCSHVNAVTHTNQIIAPVIHPLFYPPSSTILSVGGAAVASEALGGIKQSIK